MAVGDAEPLETRSHVAAGRTREQDVELGQLSDASALDDREQHVGPFDQLRLEPFAPTDAVLLERADDERGERGDPSRVRAVEPRGVVPRAEHVDVDADRDAVHLLRRDPGRRHERLHLAVRHLDAVDLGVTRAHRLEAGVELRHARRPGTPVEVRQAEVVPTTARSRAAAA